jgi:hypothetical protein
MASFAKLNSANIVITVESVVNEVLKDSNGVEQEQLGIDFLRTLYNEPNAIWKQTSYNTMVEFIITEEHLLERITQVLDIPMIQIEMHLFHLNLLTVGY